MAGTYFVRRAGAEEGPFSVAQLNRMKQNGALSGETPCRAATETAHRRLDAVFPHLKDYRADPDKVAKVVQEVTAYEIKRLMALSMGSSVFFWVPFGAIASLVAIGSGLLLLFKYRHLGGLVGLALGGLGLAFRWWSVSQR
ncbi:MAG TPA: GYF domain-containing protein [Chthoniobacteraceae bacterium]|jgi:hypothetical protein|nr:GYF domain-containing protein [Chthoniobacteraceae bacterium]